jgi:hypothetical protein
MNTRELLIFAAAFFVVLLVLLWRLIRAEDGHGFMPISRDATYGLASAVLGAFALAFFAMSACFLVVAISSK